MYVVIYESHGNHQQKSTIDTIKVNRKNTKIAQKMIIKSKGKRARGTEIKNNENINKLFEI